MDFGTFLDIFVVIVVLVSALIAFLRGFIREILTIFGIVGGIIAAYIGGPLLVPFMRGWMGVTEDSEASEKLFDLIPYSLLAEIVSYATILIVFIIILSIISHFLASGAKNLGLGALDRTFGVVFGLLRAVLVLGFMYLPAYYLIEEPQKQELFADSKTQVYLETTSRWIDGFIPKTASSALENGAESLKDVSETRKKLEEMDILKPDTNPKSVQDGKADGYTDEFRKKMDQLLEHVQEPEATQSPASEHND